MKEYIAKVSERHNLTREEARNAMRLIMEGSATESQIAAFLMGLRLKGEATEELVGFVEMMREKCIKIMPDNPDAIDLCGTGGDHSGTFNISTAASFVAAGAGCVVAKHGNRSVSGSCGSADVLRSLGVQIENSPEQTEACLNTVGIAFLFAPLFHPAMKYAAKPRAELGIKTFFNMLGPMTNPAGVRRQLVGAFHADAAGTMAAVFAKLDCKKIFIVHSRDGLDEISLSAVTDVYEVSSNAKSFQIDPSTTGLPNVTPSQIQGGDISANAALIVKVLSGEQLPHRDVVLINAAMGMVASGKASSIEEGIESSKESIDSGNAMKKLNQLREFTNA